MKIVAALFIALLVALAVYLLAVHLYKRMLTQTRDNADFTTVRGQALIKACNSKLDTINGYGLYKRIFNR